MDSNYSAYPKKWQDRFAFFDAHGAPNTPTYKAAIKALPSGKMKINFNWLAWLFGPIYFFVLGMWRRALTCIGLCIVLGIITCVLPDKIGDVVSRGGGIALSLFYGLSANYGYYLKQVKGKNGWNLFEGMRW